MEEEKYFFVDCRKRIITNLSIVNTKIANQNTVFNSEYIIYIIKVVSPFNSWYIKKRYSEIYEIYNYLVNHKPKLEFPLFPPKRLFSTKESTVIERKNGFEDVFCFILQNIEILQYQKLIEFFKIKKTLLMIYIKNCFLVNEKRFSYELMDENNSSFNSSDISLGSDKGYKEKKMSQSIKIKINKKIKTKQKDENLFNKSEKENIVGNNLKDVIENENDNNNNDSININEEKNYTNNMMKMSNLTKKLETCTNYFKCYEEYKLSLGNYTSRSQVSFFIIKELLRNLKVHSSHIFEIIDDFTDYIKLNNKWKKFNEKEIKALFVGINKNDLFEEYFQSILNDKNLTDKQSIITISEKSVISPTPNIINTNNIIIKDINDNFSTNGETIENDDDDNKIDSYYLEGLFYYIGNFDVNFYGARSCLLLLNRIFERDFNPEVDIYIKIFQKLDIKYIKKMNLYKLSSKNNCIYRKLCFNLLNLYIGEYNEEAQIKILTELNADSLLINSFLDSTFIDESINNPYNLE